jgi:N-formylglutamate amidohydrolase
LRREVIAMTDHHTLDLFARQPQKYKVVAFPISRLVVDPERFVDDSMESMSDVGMGVVYTRTSDGRQLRRSLEKSERDKLIEDYYCPHHRALHEAVMASLSDQGCCLIIDAHSFPSKALPYESDQASVRPDICIGTDDIHTPPLLRELAKAVFENRGFTVAFDQPFSGTIVPGEFFKSQSSVNSVMVEVNRKLYIDEQTGHKLHDYESLRLKISGAIDEIVNEWNSKTSKSSAS